MLEKLKALGSSLRDLFLFLVLPLAFAAGFIWKLFQENQELKDELQSSKSEQRIQALKQQAGVAEQEAADAEANYDTVRKQYLDDHPDDAS